MTTRYYVLGAGHGLTTHWHSGGAAIIEASSQEEAERIARERYPDVGWDNDEWPPTVDPIEDGDVFPDAGCC